MRVLLVIVMFSLSDCAEDNFSNKYNERIEDYVGYEEKNDFYSKNEDWRRNRDLDVVGLEKEDREDIMRPCAFEDWQCIRKFFAANSNCKPVYGPVPDPLYFERNTIYFPFVNLTIILSRLRLTGLASAKISEFYVNRDTGNLVFAIDFRDLNETSPKAFFRYKRTAKEAIVLSDYVTGQFTSGTFTAVIPKVPHLQLGLAEIHADIDDLVPSFFIGPGAFNSTDPDVLDAYAKFLTGITLAVKETFLFQAQLFTTIYIQKNICDFGLKLISV